MEINEKSPLVWPENWARTRIQDRQKRDAWKKSFRDYRDQLAEELRRLGATEMMVSYNTAGQDRMDCGVAVYFSKTQRDSFAWQDALDLLTPAPTLEEIDTAYKRKAMIHHPDRGGDIEVFKALTKHRNDARAWVLGTQRQDLEYVIACDKYKETRLNLAALRLAVHALRQLDRLGASGVLEAAFRGFKTALPAHIAAGEGEHVPTVA
jgi:hypothetical protein